jgi:DNA recombination protein RmuC
VLAVGILIYLHLSKKQEEDPTTKLTIDLMQSLRKEMQDASGSSRKEMQERLDKITEQISDHQKSSTTTIQKQFAQSNQIIKEVTEKIGKIEGTNKQVLGFAESMQNLENILKNPKQRGIVGEIFLENMLNNVLPPASYQMQYSFKSGEIVDAAIFAAEKIIPVDAKFSLDNYNRLMQENDPETRTKLESDFKADLKKRIDETSKYVKPNEGTTDYALMFIPADGVFYNILSPKVGAMKINAQDFINYAHSKQVTIVSPMTFYAQLQTILHALKSWQIENSAKEIQKRIHILGRHLNAYEEYLNKVGKSLSTTVNHYNDSSKEFKKIDKDILQITEGEEGGAFEPELLERPHQD